MDSLPRALAYTAQHVSRVPRGFTLVARCLHPLCALV